MIDYSDVFTKRQPVVTFANDVVTSNRMCNLAWERGLVVKENIIDTEDSNGIKRLLMILSYEEVNAVYVEGLYEFSKSFKKGAEILTEIRKHNVKIVMPEWELDPMYGTFEAVIQVFRDLAKQEGKRRSENIKAGQRYSKEKYGRKAGRPRTRLPLHEIAELRAKNLSWERISKELNIPKMTLYDRKDDIERYMKDYKMI